MRVTHASPQVNVSSPMAPRSKPPASPDNQTKKLPHVPMLESAGCAGLGAQGWARGGAREAPGGQY